MTVLSSGYGATSAQSRLQPESVVPLTSVYPIARVDLMPPEIHAQRRFRRARGFMVVAVAVTAGAAGLAFVLAQRSADVAADALAAEQATTATLAAEAATYDEVPAVLSSIDRVESALRSTMASDISWYPYLYQLSISAPESVWFEKITFTVLPPETVTTDPLAPVGSVATVSTAGRALAYPDVVAWVQQMDAVTTWGHALLSGAAADPDSGVVSFTTTARLTADSYSNRYEMALDDPEANATGTAVAETGTGQ